jgi:hypothetical protein
MPDRYVQLPNGSYLQWPDGVSAATFKAKATKLMGSSPKSSEPNPNDRIWSGVEGVSAYHPKTGLAGIEETLGNARERLRQFANRGSGSYKVGETSDVADLMASAPSGVMRALKGTSEVPQGKVWQGTKDIVGGAMEAGTIPSMVLAPESGVSKAAPVEVRAAAKMLTDAVNPLPKQMGAFEKSLGDQLDKVITFAQSKGMKVGSPEELAQAMKGTGDWIRQHYYENILGPVKERLASVAGNIKGYAGETSSPSNATLGQLDNRLSQINAELNPKYAKGGIAAQAAVKSATELNAEAAGIRKVLYQELGKATGIDPATIADTRKAFGSLDSLAEQTNSAASKARFAKNIAAREPVTVNPFGASKGKQFLADKAIAKMRGNPVEKSISKVVRRVETAPYELPKPNPTSVTSKLRTPLRGENPPYVPPRTSTSAEVDSVAAKLAKRREANEAAQKAMSEQRAKVAGEKTLRRARHPFWQDPRGSFDKGEP